MSDKRELERLGLTEFQQVRDPDTGGLVGYVCDLSREGLKVLGREGFQTGDRRRVALRYVRLGGESESVEIDVEVVWSQKSGDAGFHESGFRVNPPGGQAGESLARIIDDLKARADG